MLLSILIQFLDLIIKPIKWNIIHGQSSQNVQDINPNINFYFEENSPFQEGVMLETFQRPDKSFFQEPKDLGDLINKGNFCSKLVISVTEHLVEVVDKLSNTAVVFFRSERILKCKHLYGA